ncbi:hypothetical protein [Pedobacter steynii]|uniref:hypothetical protein n=1 Tax=Pedobacter steynii TaxID=430522 RepID=UPI0012FC5969|nr:hypothetical protein [Pedobacter steynii]
MKNLELRTLDVQEMSKAEMTTVKGGGLLGDFLAGTLTVVTTAVSNVVKDNAA